MPLSPLHQKKKWKNYALLALLVACILFFFALAMVKVHLLGGG